MTDRLLSIPITWDFSMNLLYVSLSLGRKNSTFNSHYLGFLHESSMVGTKGGFFTSTFNSHYLGFLHESWEARAIHNRYVITFNSHYLGFLHESSGRLSRRF